MKLYVSADMEGLAGVASGAQLVPGEFDWDRACDIFTGEVAAVAEELQAAGAREITVSDSHGTGQNLRLDRLPRGVRVVRSWPRPLGMMDGIDASFDGAVLLGYHAGGHNPRGVRAHTMSSANLLEIALNGRVVCEAELSAAIAAHFGVPVLLVSGDDALAEELAEPLPAAEKVIVKRAVSFHSTDSLLPQDAIEALRAGVRRALARHADIEPRPLPGPIALDVAFKYHRPAELLAYLPIVERVDAHRVRFEGRDILEVSRFLEFALGYSADLKP